MVESDSFSEGVVSWTWPIEAKQRKNSLEFWLRAQPQRRKEQGQNMRNKNSHTKVQHEAWEEMLDSPNIKQMFTLLSLATSYTGDRFEMLYTIVRMNMQIYARTLSFCRH